MTNKTLNGATAVRLRPQHLNFSSLFRVGLLAVFPTLATWDLQAQSTNIVGQATLTRAVKCTARRGTLYLGGMIVQTIIDLKGNNVSADSFDSADPLKSSNGQWDPAKTGDKGDVYTNLGITNSMNVGNANIFGHAHTGPGGTLSVGPNGAVGEHSWQAFYSGIEPGWASDDSNYTFPANSLPYASGLTPMAGNVVSTTTVPITTNTVTSATLPSPPPTGPVTTNVTSTTTSSTYPNPAPPTVTTNSTLQSSSSYPVPTPANVTTNITVTKKGKVITTYTWPVYTYTYPNYSYTYAVVSTGIGYTTNHYDNILYSGDYYATALSGSTIVLGQARLVLPNGFNQASKDSFTVGPNASVAVYADGTTATINTGGVNNNNYSGLAANFMLFCTPNVTQFNMGSTATFIGALVAPNANVIMSGGGNSTVNYVGCLIANSVKMNGHYNFHFDEALGRIWNGRYLVTSWNEIAPH
jgi:hypothetical protein